MNKPVTLYLADDHQIVIDGLKLLISNEESMRIVGYAYDGETACAEILAKQPDIALVDFSMPKLTGLELILSLKKTAPNTKFIILSMYGKPNDIRNAKNGGASGYILKNVGKTEMMQCLSAVLNGGTYFPDLLHKKEIDSTLFTPREIEILKLILDHHTTPQIADRLCLAHSTVVTHRKNICRKTEENTPLGFLKFLRDNQIEL